MPYTPIVVVASVAPLKVTMGGNLSYQSFLNSLGTDVYRVMGYYIKTTSRDQLQQEIKYQISDADGNLTSNVISTSIDPNQKQNAYRQDLKDQNIVLNRFSTLQFDILPGEHITLALEMLANKASTGLPGETNQEKAIDGLDNGFFKKRKPKPSPPSCEC
jgi:hypothetical protein